MRTFTTFALPALMGMLLAAPAALADDLEARRAITVSASGQVAAEPDQARISSGVDDRGGDRRAGTRTNSDVMKKLIDGLKESGIDPKDIQTASFNV